MRAPNSRAQKKETKWIPNVSQSTNAGRREAHTAQPYTSTVVCQLTLIPAGRRTFKKQGPQKGTKLPIWVRPWYPSTRVPEWDPKFLRRKRLPVSSSVKTCQLVTKHNGWHKISSECHFILRSWEIKGWKRKLLSEILQDAHTEERNRDRGYVLVLVDLNAQIGNDVIVNVPERVCLPRENETGERVFEIRI